VINTVHSVSAVITASRGKHSA